MSNTYDQLIYSSLPRPESQPAHLATIAKLFGLSSPAIHKARVLELGCGTGGNIIPLAELWPDSSFLGIDLSGKQIELGNKIIEDLKFKNITLRQESILDFPAEAGEFDYIICHGVFSWVNRAIQDKILEICANHLSSNGLAYISYNTFPGWKFKGAIREMMQYHTQNIVDPEEKAQQAKALIQFLAHSQTDINDPYADILHKSFQELKPVPTHYLFHEYLEEENQAFYFNEFTARLENKGLAYVADAQFSLMSFVDLPSETQTLLESLDNRVKLEQYLDFIRNRKLRESIICKSNLKICYPAIKSGFNDFYVSAEFVDNREEATSIENGVNIFTTSKGGVIKTNNSLTAQAMKLLRQSWPGQWKIGNLALESAKIIQLNLSSEEGKLLYKNFEEELSLFHSANLLELELNQYLASANYSGKPRASDLARYQALRQERITSLRHKSVELESIVRQILFLLDGQREASSIASELEKLCNSGELQIQFQEKAPSKIELQSFLTTIVDRSLKLLAKHSFLTLEQAK